MSTIHKKNLHNSKTYAHNEIINDFAHVLINKRDDVMIIANLNVGSKLVCI